MNSATFSGRTFSELLNWHLINGTRPPGQGNAEWTSQKFIGALRRGITDKAVRNWRRGKNLPRFLDHIERALFGEEPIGQALEWRDELRAAYCQAQSARRAARPSIPTPNLATSIEDVVAQKETIALIEPEDLLFLELEVKVSDVWDQLLSWIGTQMSGFRVDSIEEDLEAGEPSFKCTGKPGSLAFPVLATGDACGAPCQLAFDLIVNWLHDLVVNRAPAPGWQAWDTALWPVELRIGGASETIEHPLASNFRDATYWVLFVKPK